MSTAAVLVILVVAGEAQSPVITSMFDAATEVVGAGGAVRIVEVAALSDAEAQRVEQTASARAAVQLSWRDDARLHAHLRLHAPRTDRWVDRNIDFVPEDTPLERGRTLGFAIASMLPEGDPTLRFEAPATPPPPAPLGRHAFGLSATGTLGLGGPASGYGGVATIERFLDEGLSLDLALAARLGRIDDLDGRELVASAGAGAAWWPVPSTPLRRFGLAVRLEALLMYHAVSHHRAGGTSSGVEWKGYLLPGAGFKIEGTFRLASALELLVGGGAEVGFGTIDVTVVAAPPAGGSARIPPLRAMAEAGIRARF